MFLFSGTFFPITQLPGWIQPVAYLTPLWHGVELTRAAALGIAPAWSAWVHVGYLLLWFAAAHGHRPVQLPAEAGEVTSGTLIARVVPPAALGSRRSLRLVERNLLVYRRIWVIVFSGFFEPVFYLFAVDRRHRRAGGRHRHRRRAHVVSYAEFVAPALLASSAMNGAVYESTMNIFFKLKWAKTYDAVLATPLGPGDVAVGEISWSLAPRRHLRGRASWS